MLDLEVQSSLIPMHQVVALLYDINDQVKEQYAHQIICIKEFQCPEYSKICDVHNLYAWPQTLGVVKHHHILCYVSFMKASQVA